MIFLMPEYNKPEKKSSEKYTPYELGVKEGKEVDFKLLSKPKKMKEKTIAIIGMFVVTAVIIVVMTLITAWIFKGTF